jgi:hypothetical protein
MKKKILFVLAGLVFAVMMMFNFNQSQSETASNVPPVNLWGLNSVEAQPENCPCNSSDCSCGYKVVPCEPRGSQCKGKGGTCGSETSCMG